MNFAQAPRIEHTPDGRKLLHVTFEVPTGEDLPSPLELETQLQRSLNAVGTVYMKESLTGYDTHGEQIMVGKAKLTSKGKSPQTYETLFGPVSLERHVYQGSAGGTTFCPLEERARMVQNMSIGLCQVLASKYANLSARAVQRDIALSHQLELHVSRLQDVANELGKRAQGKEDHWVYKSPGTHTQAVAITVYVDGTCVALVGERYKQVMVGAIDILDDDGERLETVYLAQAPEDGKATFFTRMEQELDLVKRRYPGLRCVGLSDGASDLQRWLEDHCDFITLDFYHVSEYVSAAAVGFGNTEQERKDWMQDTLHKLKHHADGAVKLLRQLRAKSSSPELNQDAKTVVEAALGYVERNRERMKYKDNRKLHLPIGSGVIEAACKHVVKARVAGSGMRWKRGGLQGVLTLRSLQESTGRWAQFWRKVEVLGW
jgi:hypothetical protein